MSTCQSILRSWPCLNIETVFPGMGIPRLKNRLGERLIFNKGIPILVKWHLYIETAPGCFISYLKTRFWMYG